MLMHVDTCFPCNATSLPSIGVGVAYWRGRGPKELPRLQERTTPACLGQGCGGKADSRCVPRRREESISGPQGKTSPYPGRWRPNTICLAHEWREAGGLALEEHSIPGVHHSGTDIPSAGGARGLRSIGISTSIRKSMGSVSVTFNRYQTYAWNRTEQTWRPAFAHGHVSEPQHGVLCLNGNGPPAIVLLPPQTAFRDMREHANQTSFITLTQGLGFVAHPPYPLPHACSTVQQTQHLDEGFMRVSCRL